MKNVIAGATAATTAAPTLHVGPYRRALLAVIIGCPLFTDAEQVLANHNAHACQDAQRLATWTRNVLRERERREAADLAKAEQAAAAPTGNLLADLQNPAYVAQHGEKQAAPGFQTLTVADAYKAAESLRQAFAAAQQPTAPAPAAAPAYATAEQCSEVHRLACQLPAREKADALRRLPQLTEPEAAAFIRGLRLRQGSRLRLPVTLRGQLVQVPVAERHLEAARVDYFAHLTTGRVLPRTHQEVFWHSGQPVRQLWAN